VALIRALPVEVQGHQPSALHGSDRAWGQTNCYADLWIETLHGAGFNEVAALPFCVRTDFEGDHFTFFKHPAEDLQTLYGVTVQELPIWRSVLWHTEQQLAQGRLVAVEFDSWFLPDTTGTAYRQAHVKTTVAITALDAQERRCTYFHNAGHYALSGDDFDGVFRLTPPLSGNPDVLPPYVELVKFDREAALHGQALLDASVQLLRAHLGHRPRSNPITRFRPRFAEDLAWLATQPMEMFHLYAFNTLRQLGASSELLCSWLGWAAQQGGPAAPVAAEAFQAISDTCKALLFQLARISAKRKVADLSAPIGTLEAQWERGMAALVHACG
jgi:hypothetical protein